MQTLPYVVESAMDKFMCAKALLFYGALTSSFSLDVWALRSQGSITGRFPTVRGFRVQGLGF